MNSHLIWQPFSYAPSAEGGWVPGTRSANVIRSSRFQA